MVAELTKAFQDATSTYKVLSELYTALFKTPKVEEEVGQTGWKYPPLGH